MYNIKTTRSGTAFLQVPVVTGSVARGWDGITPQDTSTTKLVVVAVQYGYTTHKFFVLVQKFGMTAIGWMQSYVNAPLASNRDSSFPFHSTTCGGCYTRNYVCGCYTRDYVCDCYLTCEKKGSVILK